VISIDCIYVKLYPCLCFYSISLVLFDFNRGFFCIRKSFAKFQILFWNLFKILVYCFFLHLKPFGVFFCVNFLFGVNFSALLRSSRNFFACTIKNLLVPVKEIIIEKFKN